MPAFVTPNLTLAVLAFNEEENVAGFLDDCLSYLGSLEGDHEIIVVDDGSTDATAARALAVAQRDRRVRVLSHPRNLGMGAGMRTAFANARGEYVTILAADGQVRARELDKLLPELSRTPIVLSVYSRRANELYRLGISLGFRALMRLLLGTPFRLEGIYLFPTRLAREEIGLDTISPNTFFFSFELISRAITLGYGVRTVTVEPLPRVHGQSKVVSPRRILGVASEVVRFRIRLAQERRRGARRA